MMKKILFLISVMGLAFFFNACRKSDNPKVPELVKSPVPVFKLNANSLDTRIIDAENFKSMFTLGLYFPDDTRPQKADLVVAMNGQYDKVKVLQADIKSFPSDVTITGAQLAAAFGLTASNVPEATRFEVRAQFTTASGILIPAFGLAGNPYSSDLQNLPGSSLTLTYEVPCDLVVSNFNGEFEVVTDEWGDYGSGDIVNVTYIDATHVSFKYDADDAQPIIVTIDPATFATSVAKQYYGNYGPGYYFSAESLAGNKANIVGTCDNSISVRLDHSTPTDGSYGAYTIKLRKKVN